MEIQDAVFQLSPSPEPRFDEFWRIMRRACTLVPPPLELRGAVSTLLKLAYGATVRVSRNEVADFLSCFRDFLSCFREMPVELLGWKREDYALAITLIAPSKEDYSALVSSFRTEALN